MTGAVNQEMTAMHFLLDSRSALIFSDISSFISNSLGLKYVGKMSACLLATDNASARTYERRGCSRALITDSAMIKSSISVAVVKNISSFLFIIDGEKMWEKTGQFLTENFGKM
ncbi:hypothetical protein [Acetobacter aceti]|uniref:Uncharacterized protein n=1 Tax=Acetobacter aceti TaxID=435 RepID=A0A6S6PMY5_ACEAC|nr:hypothetical protein [Acetobacter aceti]BCI68116.1 hypothetical protein AAJCM20276_27400 [Acetobacter aceti]